MSNGTLDLSRSSLFGWYTLANTRAQLAATDRGTVVNMARTAASTAGADLSGFMYTLAFVNGTPTGRTGNSVAMDILASNGQDGWRWCSKCEGFAFWGGWQQSPAPCIGTGVHDHSDSSYYSLPHDTNFPDGQPGWRMCAKCQALIFDTANPAPCPGNGTHSLDSAFQYVVRMNSTAPNEQQNWRWCNKCQALAYFDFRRLPGLCPVNGRHDHTGSGNYSIPFAWSASMGILGHETGHVFGLDHAFGTSRSGDFGNDTRPGAYGDWTDIMSWAGTAQFAAPLYTPVGAGLSAPTLYKMGWLSDSECVTILPPTNAKSVSLKPLYGATGGSPRMVRVVKPDQGWVYTAEFRAPQSWDQGIKTPRVVIHAMRTLYQSGQDGWRTCKNCQGFVYAGQTVCPAGGVHDGSGSNEYGLPLYGGEGEPGWRWCQKCSGMFYGAGQNQGVCPAGGGHDASQSHPYFLILTGGGSGQSNWKWCLKCQGLAFAGNPASICPAGGMHDYAGSHDYTLASAGLGFENKWRWCGKCQGLYYAGLGACMGADSHIFSGDDYAPVHDLMGSAGQAGWRYCRKCYAMAFNDGSRPPGFCAAGGVHDHSTSGNYIIEHDAEAEASER
jgi:hypothetical protein